MKTHRGITIVSGKSEQLIEERALVLYENDQKKLVDWLLDEGKNPANSIGYSKSTVETAIYRIDQFHRYVWDEFTDGYTLLIDQEHANRYLQHIAMQDYENSYKKGIEKALKLLFKWKHHERGEKQWELEWGFKTSSDVSPDDCLSGEERAALREAALKYGQIPSYSNVSPQERDRWKQYLAQRFGKEKNEITKDDWKQANSWKVPSLLWTSLDAGLRPSEVERANLSWLDLEDGVLQIPKSEDSEEDSWIVGLRKQTVRALENWLQEREQYSVYDGSDKLWLTRQGNPYQSDSLNYLLRKLCDLANIDTSDRKVTWMTLRESLGVHLADEGDLSHVREQLRYESPRSTMRYGSSVEKRREILERIN